MDIRTEQTGLDGLVIVHQQIAGDERGYFQEVYRDDVFRPLGVGMAVMQINKSRSAKNVVRGLHFQWDRPLAKLMRVTLGRAFLVAVDIRKNSPTLGKWYGREFHQGEYAQLYGEPGFARGFCALTDFAEIEYLGTATYNPNGESGIRWDDAEIGIAWPLDGAPTLSAKDRDAQSLRQWLARPEADRFRS